MAEQYGYERPPVIEAYREGKRDPLRFAHMRNRSPFLDDLQAQVNRERTHDQTLEDLRRDLAEVKAILREILEGAR